MFNVLRRSNRLHSIIGNGFEVFLRPQYQPQKFSHINQIRFYLSNGNGFRSLGIAGSNTLMHHYNDMNHCNNFNDSFQYHQIRHFPKSRIKCKKRKEPHNQNWNNQYIHDIDYNEDDIQTKQQKHGSKQNDFEYLEILKQKYRQKSPPKTQSKHVSIRRNFSSNNESTINALNQNENENKNIEQPKSAPLTPPPPPPPQSLSPAAATAAAQQIMAKEDEINPTSIGGLFVLVVGAAIFYWLFNIDQQKHSEVSSFLSRFTRTRSIEDIISEQEKKPIHKIPDDWNAGKVILNHVQNIFLSYNSEWIWSKLFRLFYIPSPKLLPPVKANIYTLVIDIDTICHSTWSRNEGFERKMRPHYSEFLSRMALCGWEIVLFGQCEQYDWEESPDIIKLDGKGFVQNYLWNNSSYYFNGHRCKDISRLNRDLKRVIVIDSDPRSVQLQPKNAIILNKWTQNKLNANNDTQLLKLIEFLEYLAKAEVSDVRQVLGAYRGKDIAEEFRKRYFAAVHAQLVQKEGAYDNDEEDEDQDIDEEDAQQMYQ